MTHGIFLLDLKQELRLRNSSVPPNHNESNINLTSTPTRNISSSTAAALDGSVSTLNELNDSKNNNNLSFNASMDYSIANNTKSSLVDSQFHSERSSMCGDLSNRTLTESSTTLNDTPTAPSAAAPLNKSSQSQKTVNTSQKSVLKCKFLKLLACWSA
jgi:hypothetical protein